tara:strand:+ start:455 stop:781 length:327 start_codon:yes stop_codon:yes gene_type:complete
MYINKYKKYKSKYLNLKKIGGSMSSDNNKETDNYKKKTSNDDDNSSEGDSLCSEGSIGDSHEFRNYSNDSNNLGQSSSSYSILERQGVNAFINFIYTMMNIKNDEDKK